MTRLSDWEEFQDDDLDLGTADLLLDGALAQSDVPDGYREIFSLIKTVKQGLRPDEMDWEPPVVATMMSAIRLPAPVRRQRSRRLVLRPQVAMAVGAIGILSGSAAAAASGSLSTAVQTAVHKAAADIGVAVPTADSDHHSVSVSGTARPARTAVSRSGSSGYMAPIALGKVVAAEKDANSKGTSVLSILLKPPASSSASPTPTPIVTSASVPDTTGAGASTTSVSSTTGPPQTTTTTSPVGTTPTTAAPGSNGHGHSGKASSTHSTTGH